MNHEETIDSVLAEVVDFVRRNSVTPERLRLIFNVGIAALSAAEGPRDESAEAAEAKAA